MQAYLAYVMFYRFSQSHRFIMISVSRVPRTLCARSSRFYRDTFSSALFFMVPFFKYTHIRESIRAFAPEISNNKYADMHRTYASKVIL